MSVKTLTALVSAVALLGCQAGSNGDGQTSGSASGQAGASGGKRAPRTPGAASGERTAPASSERSGGGGLLGILKPDPILIPEGTTLNATLESSLSSKTNRTGDLVVARLVEDVKSGDKVLLRAGTELRGHVTAAVPSGRTKTRARLAFAFDGVMIEGKEHSIEASATDITAGDTRKRDAAVVAGGAGAGAIIGAIKDGKKGAGIGAIIGGAAGTGVILADRGKEVEVPAGSTVTFTLRQDARIN